jgi:CRP-like cAMP-binding protein
MHQALRALLPPARERRLDRGEPLFRAGDRALGLVLVRSGGLELIRISAEGRRSVLQRAGPGDTFAEASLFESHHHCDAVATAPSTVEVHPAAELRRAAAADPELPWRIAAHLADRLVAARARAERLALPHAADRLLDVLHALPAEPDGTRRLGRSWKALAAELGLSHEATYRALARLERAGLLRREDGGRLRLPAAPAAPAGR